jgi:hypothetical protein
MKFERNQEEGPEKAVWRGIQAVRTVPNVNAKAAFLMTECKTKRFEFHALSNREVIGHFDGGDISSDGGGLLLREVEQRTGILKQLAGCFTDYRKLEWIEHPVQDLLAQRVYGMCLGYEDLNDHDHLRADPALAVMVGKVDPKGEDRIESQNRGKALAGKSTLNRLELTKATTERYKKIVMNPEAIDRMMVEQFLDAHPQAEKQIILDMDATDDPIHGHQEGRFFHGYYDCYCYLPLYIFCGEFLLSAKLRTSDIDPAKGALEDLKRVVSQIRQRWPRVHILVRGDSGFCRDELMKWCERQEIDYVFGLAKNPRLLKEIEVEMKAAEADFNKSQEPVRIFKNFRYRTLGRYLESQSTRGGQSGAFGKRQQPAICRHVFAAVSISGAGALRNHLLRSWRYGKPDQGTTDGTVCRSAQHRIDARQSVPFVLLFGRLHADARTASVSSKRHGAGKRTMSDDSIEAAENRRAD